jgi:hypothetical protein
MVLRSTTTRTALLVLVTALLAALLVATPAAPGSAADRPVRHQPVQAVVDDGPASPLVAPHCERVSAIAAVAAGGVVACRNVTVCKILVATVGAALTTWWTAITRYDRCLFTYSTGTSTRPALVRC